MPASELELLAAAHRGEADAVDELLARHEKQVYRFGLRMCGNEEDARDVLQETLLAAFRGIGDFRGDSRLSTWLYQIASSFCSKSRRRGAGEPERYEPVEAAEAQGVAAEGDQPDALAHAKEIGKVLQAAILALSPASREVVVLRDVEGLSAEEAAKVLGVEVGALKSRLHRARLELRERLGHLLEPDASPGPALCPELADVLREASGEIDQAACARVEHHLASCRRCGSAEQGLQRAVEHCRLLPGGEVPGRVQVAVRQALARA